jgi:hypothetical protein
LEQGEGTTLAEVVTTSWLAQYVVGSLNELYINCTHYLMQAIWVKLLRNINSYNTYHCDIITIKVQYNTTHHTIHNTVHNTIHNTVHNTIHNAIHNTLRQVA